MGTISRSHRSHESPIKVSISNGRVLVRHDGVLGELVIQTSFSVDNCRVAKQKKHHRYLKIGLLHFTSTRRDIVPERDRIEARWFRYEARHLQHKS